jgi:hypothetical protein
MPGILKKVKNPTLANAYRYQSQRGILRFAQDNKPGFIAWPFPPHPQTSLLHQSPSAAQFLESR